MKEYFKVQKEHVEMMQCPIAHCMGDLQNQDYLTILSSIPKERAGDQGVFKTLFTRRLTK